METIPQANGLPCLTCVTICWPPWQSGQRWGWPAARPSPWPPGWPPCPPPLLGVSWQTHSLANLFWLLWAMSTRSENDQMYFLWKMSVMKVMLATIIWWGVFYSPGDLVYSISKNKLVYIPVCVIKEIYRAKKVVGGMGDARKLFPENEMIILMIGTLKGNGSGFMKPITRLIIGDWVPAKTEILKMSATTKECVAASFFLLGHELG